MFNFNNYLKKDDINNQLGTTMLALAVNAAGLVVVIGAKIILNASSSDNEDSEESEE